MHFKQHSVEGKRGKKLAWWAVWCACLWSIWLARNQVVFQGAVVNVESVFEAAQFRAWNWLMVNSNGFSYSIFELNLNPRMCIEGIG